eukprot:ANDGO_06674.mRNA.1 hypothetical protein
MNRLAAFAKAATSMYVAGAAITGVTIAAVTVPAVMAYPRPVHIGPLDVKFHVREHLEASFERSTRLQRLVQQESLWIVDTVLFWPMYAKHLLMEEYRNVEQRKIIVACDIVPSKMSAVEISLH